MSYADKPIAFREDGSAIYDNTPTVVAVIFHTVSCNHVSVIRRNTNPGKGLLALPGGYQMRSDKSWQHAGAREVREELGYEINPALIKLVSVTTDSYGNNLIIGRFEKYMGDGITRFDGWEPNQEEVVEELVINKHSFALHAGEWAFPLHLLEVQKNLFEKNC